MRTNGVKDGMAGILAILLAGLFGAGCDGSRSGIAPTGAADTTAQVVETVPDSSFLGMNPDSAFQKRTVSLRLAAGWTYRLVVRDDPHDPRSCNLVVRDSIGVAWLSIPRIGRRPIDTGAAVTGCIVDFPSFRTGRYDIEILVAEPPRLPWLTVHGSKGIDERVVGPDSQELNNSIRTATPLQELQLVDGTSHARDVDHFRFIAPREGTYEIAFAEDERHVIPGVDALRPDSTIQYLPEGVAMTPRFSALAGDTVIVRIHSYWLRVGEDSTGVYGGRYRFRVRRIGDPPSYAVFQDPGEASEASGPRAIKDDQARIQASLHGIGFSPDRDAFRMELRRDRDYTIWVESKWPTVEMSIQNLDLTVTSWPAIVHMGDSLQAYTFRSLADGTFRFTLYGRPTPYVISASSQPTSLR